MNENYINIIRKTLYENADSGNVKIHGKPRKIIFARNEYKSENVFAPDSISDVGQNEITRNTKKKKSKKIKRIVNDKQFQLDNNPKIPLNLLPHCKRKKLQLFSNFSDGSTKENFRNTLSPSMSEIDISCFSKRLPIKKKPKIYHLRSYSDDIVASFNLNDFCYARECVFNESLAETLPLSSIYCEELISDSFDDVKISSGNIIDSESDILNDQNNEEQSDTSKISNIQNEVIFNKKKSETCKEDNIYIPVDSETSEKTNGPVDISFDFTNNEKPNFTLSSEKAIIHVEPLTNVAKYFDAENGKLVVLPENCSIYIFGLFNLKVLHGALEVLGHTLDRNSNSVNFYSPRGSALLYIKNVTVKTDESNATIANALNISELTNDEFEETSVVFECTKLDDKQILFIEKYISQQIFPKLSDDNIPRVVFEPTENWNTICIPDSWDDICNSINASSKLLVAGGKGVGKSTFVKYIINRLLNKFSKVRVIDLDPGQSEFSVPGCVSILTVTKPVFGPNYTHLRDMYRSYLSNINVAHDPRSYIKCIDMLMKDHDCLETIPTIINYMGFAQGIGLNIISSALTYIQPTDVVQIVSRSSKKNFKADLSPELVQENCNLFQNNSMSTDFRLHKIVAMTDNNEGWALEPRQVREMSILAYFGEMMQDNVNSISSHKLPIYEIAFSSIKIMNLEHEEISPAAANASLVALCFLEDYSDTFVCLGYGVVRGVDLENEILVLLTPEAPSVLEKVYNLVVGSVSLPPSVYMTPDDITGTIPYVMEGELTSLGQIIKRSYLPVSKK